MENGTTSGRVRSGFKAVTIHNLLPNTIIHTISNTDPFVWEITEQT